MNSGWGYKYPNKTAVFGTIQVDDPSQFHFPAWHEDAIQWLINKRSINMVGVDTPSNDYGQSKTFPVHVHLSKENRPGLENVAHLDKLPVTGAEVFAPVIKTTDGSGGPARIFAVIIKANNDITSGSTIKASTTFAARLISVTFILSVLANPCY